MVTNNEDGQINHQQRERSGCDNDDFRRQRLACRCGLSHPRRHLLPVCFTGTNESPQSTQALDAARNGDLPVAVRCRGPGALACRRIDCGTSFWDSTRTIHSPLLVFAGYLVSSNVRFHPNLDYVLNLVARIYKPRLRLLSSITSKSLSKVNAKADNFWMEYYTNTRSALQLFPPESPSPMIFATATTANARRGAAQPKSAKPPLLWGTAMMTTLIFFYRVSPSKTCPKQH